MNSVLLLSDVLVLLIFDKLESEKVPDSLVNFEGKHMVDHILKIPSLLVFGVKCLIVMLQNYVYEIIPRGTKTIKKSSFNFHVYWIIGTIFRLKTKSQK